MEERVAHSRAPRQLRPGLHWLFACDVVVNDRRVSHSYKSAFLLDGGRRTILIDTGHPTQWKTIEAQLDAVLGARPLDFVFPTHAEYVHAGNLPMLLDKYPAAVAVGDLRGFHLYFPGYEARFRNVAAGGTIDLGDVRLRFVAPIIYDLPQTLWAYVPARGVLFVSDGLAHEHHTPVECGRTTDELPELPAPENFALYNDRAFYWSRYVDMDVYFERLRGFLRDNPTTLMAPAHGTVITNLHAVIERAEAGMARRNAAGV